MRRKYKIQKYMPIWGPMGSMGRGRWAKADGPGPMGLKDPGLEDPGLEDPPVGVYFRARGRWGPMGSMGLGDPPMGVPSSKYPPSDTRHPRYLIP